MNTKRSENEKGQKGEKRRPRNVGGELKKVLHQRERLKSLGTSEMFCQKEAPFF